jgi:ABC-2 type transport system ATP-binding protein
MPAAELRSVTKRYGPVEALRGIDLTIAPGELVALLGPNGAGKTTAVRILLGLAQPTSGQATVFGRPPAGHEAKLRRGALLQVAKVPAWSPGPLNSHSITGVPPCSFQRCWDRSLSTTLGGGD